MQYILSSQGIRIHQEPASFAARLAAFSIDFILMGIAWSVLFATYGAGLLSGMNNVMAIILVILIPYLYPLISETVASGQTLGKKLLHIRVVDLEGGGPKISAFILRWLILPLDVFGSAGIGPLCVFFTKHQQRLGDLVAGTWVVRTQEYEKVDFSSLVAEEG
ncbi:MAG: RDD family protein [Prevotella sp.]|nr:RDD family protein [Prevotella sp.]